MKNKAVFLRRTHPQSCVTRSWTNRDNIRKHSACAVLNLANPLASVLVIPRALPGSSGPGLPRGFPWGASRSLRSALPARLSQGLSVLPVPLTLDWESGAKSSSCAYTGLSRGVRKPQRGKPQFTPPHPLTSSRVNEGFGVFTVPQASPLASTKARRATARLGGPPSTVEDTTTPSLLLGATSSYLTVQGQCGPGPGKR